VRAPQRHSLCSLALAACLLAVPAVSQGQYSNQEAAKQAETPAPAPTNKGSSFRDTKKQNRASLSMHRKDERFQKRLGEAIEYFQADAFAEALEILGDFRLKSLNPLERAETYRMYAYVYSADDNTPKAREYLRKAINEDALPPAQNSEMLYQIAQLYVSEERWPEVLQTLEEWFALEPNPNSAAYFLLAIAHYQDKNIDAALPAARKAVEIAQNPREPWLRLLLALELTQQNFEASIPLLEELITRYPKKLYWVQLSTVHGVLENYENALIPLQFAFQQELLDQDTEYRRLAQLLLFLNLPYRASEVMRVGLDKKFIEEDSEAYELLGNSRIEAKEFDEAVEPIEQAALLSDNGELYLRLAQVHAQREKWNETAKALNKALEKGDFKRPGEAEFLMGVAYYNQNKPEKAMRWFRRAKRYEATKRDSASWLQYIDRELRAKG